MNKPKGKLWINGYFKSHILSIQLLSSILMFGAFIALVAISVQIHYEYKNSIAALNERIEHFGSNAARSISYSLWKADQGQIQIQLDNLLLSEDIAYAAIYRTGDSSSIASVGAISADLEQPFFKSFDLTAVDNPYPGHKVGMLKIAADLEGVKRSRIDGAWSIAISQFVKTTIAFFFMLFVINWLVTRHLITISRFAKSLSLDNLHTGLTLNRKTYGQSDELTEVVDSINLMREQLIHEIEALNEAEYKLYQEREKKIEALTENRIKSKFLAVMSHEIRTPMNGIIGMLEILNQTHLNQVQLHYVDVALNSSETLLALLNDILDFSKISAGEVTLAESPFNLKDLVVNVSDSFAHDMIHKEIDFVTEFDPSLSPYILGDAARLRQVIENLLNNAFKFTHRGKISLCVTLLCEDLERTGIKFIVRDTGIGISDEKLEDVFQMYKQVDDNDKQLYGGTGLGLSICKSLVGLMGGFITVISEKNCWTEFAFNASFKNSLTVEVEENNENNKDELLNGCSLLTVGAADGMSENIMRYCRALGIHCDNAESEMESLDQLTSAYSKDREYHFVFIANVFSKESILNIVNGYQQSSKNNNTVFIVAITADQAIGIDIIGVKFIYVPIHCHQLKEIMLDCLLNKEDKPLDIKKNVVELPELADLSVLIVEDNAVNRVVLTSMLSQFRIKPSIACSGAEAIDRITKEKERYHLILMDCEMPVIDGFEATKTIRKYEIDHDLPVVDIIAVSAHVLDEKKQLASACGMQGFIDKPVRLESLKDLLVQYRELY